jgi:omega-amidase
MRCTLGDVPANCAQIAALAADASRHGCDALVLPEMCDTGYEMGVIQKTAAPWPGPAHDAVQKAAANNRIHIVAGLSEREGGDIFNSLAVFGTSGNLLSKYRKTHLFPVSPVCEDKNLKAGDSVSLVTIGPLRCGLMICYDLRFPELARTLTLQGAEVLIVCAAWPFPRVSHWITLAHARAIENQCYVMAVNHVGTDGTSTYCGSSRIVDPYGVVAAAGAEDLPSLIVGEVNPGLIKTVRERMPVLKHRREDVYDLKKLNR